ncbi:fimbrial protein, partial [Escherichia coli]|nr:fimbrial protein [Escherichia coli]
MMLKRSRFTELMAAGLLLTSAQVLAVDVPIKITGTIQIPPCEVNEGREIVVDFKDVSVTDVANERNRRKVDVPFRCSYSQGTAYVKVTGTQLGSNTNVLKTNVDNFGIALYQGDGTATKLVLGDGKHNGMD